jgi:hypothetical protein
VEVHKSKPQPPQHEKSPQNSQTRYPICPVINWQNALAYKLAKLVYEIFSMSICLPDTFSVKNSIQLMTDLQEIPYSEKLRFVSFDINNMYSNVSTTEIPQIISIICDQLFTTKQFKKELIALVRTIIKNNYFQFRNQTYRQHKGLAMGAPSSSIVSEVYLQ